ncbi:hypothetical protein B9Z55_024953 [Caenorhabditis nigoni]|uniref:SH2 domain-containing protein n=1 Tax=Caenorhabditis nigoni TaxID=1611254 RepID=A0A2G5SWU4_9PELO|nr:hypothetical protein B9Z55_024953 [Caenorhabditis nigoni]
MKLESISRALRRIVSNEPEFQHLTDKDDRDEIKTSTTHPDYGEYAYVRYTPGKPIEIIPTNSKTFRKRLERIEKMNAERLRIEKLREEDDKQLWFFKGLTRYNAEDKLKIRGCIEGSFLITTNPNQRKEYAFRLTLFYVSKTSSGIVRPKTIVWFNNERPHKYAIREVKQKFENLTSLVRYLIDNKIQIDGVTLVDIFQPGRWPEYMY